MSRFQNKLVVGGSDSESSDNENEYFRQEMVNLKYAQQCMYNATMYNVMMQNMMPCIPMPCLPAYGYPLPYPPMINEFPVNHPMAAGTYYRKGGRQHRSRRNKTKSRSRLEGDDVRYRTHPKQHLVQRHQYYTSSSESDNDDECPDTRGKGVQACQSVSHKIAADKLKSVNTLGRSNPNGQHRLQNRPIEPLSSSKTSAENGSRVTGRSGIAATCHKMPLNNPNNANALMTKNACQQGEHTNEPSTPDMHIAACKTMLLCHNGQVPGSMGIQPEHDRDYDISIKSPSVASSLYSGTCTSSQTAILVTSEGDQGRQPTAAKAQEENTATNSLPLSENTPPSSHMVASDTADDRGSKSGTGSQLTQPAAPKDSAEYKVLKTRVSTEHGRVMSSFSLQSHSNTTVQVLKAEQDGSTPGHRQDSAQILDLGNTTHNLKCLQSLHSLRKMWAEWETKYRPPPVSVYTGRGAGPQNLHASISQMYLYYK